ncbi:unnamed protein product, partial [Ascophyllum nodosum]
RRVDDYYCSPGQGGRAQDGGTRGERFKAKWITAEKTMAGLRYAVVCPNVIRKAKKRIAQSKRARAGSLAIVNKPQMAQTRVIRVFLFADTVLLFSGILFRFFFAFVESAAF